MTERVQVSGDHYQGTIQPIDYFVAQDFDFLQANVSKYVARHKKKNGKQDILKSIHYCLFILKYDYEAIDDEQINQVMKVLDS